jgi:hypothetical protein
MSDIFVYIKGPMLPPGSVLADAAISNKLYHFDQKFVTRHAQKNRTSVWMYNPAIGEGSLAKIQKSRTIGRNTTEISLCLYVCTKPLTTDKRCCYERTHGT